MNGRRDLWHVFFSTLLTAIVSVYSCGGDPALIESYAAAGIDRAICWLPPADEATVMTALDDLAARVGAYLVD